MTKSTFVSGRARTGLLLAALLGLSACAEGEGLDFLKKSSSSEEVSAVTPVAGDGTERDVEAPEIFSANEPGLWDGRPSLGGVWVAYPGIKDPERVIIRNTTNGKFVIGALFRRERDNPGPKLQMSSDAADALGMLAGQPVEISVVALRKEEVAPAPVLPDALPEGTQAEATDVEGLPETGEIQAASLDTVEAATAAIDRASDATTSAAASTQVATPAPAPQPAAPAPQTASLEKSFIQIGIFSVKGNADNTATSLRGAGVVPIVKEQSNQGKAFYRVLVGPASNKSERAALLKKVKELGFNDAYFVTN